MTTKTAEKKSGFELAHELRELEETVNQLLEEADGEINEEIEQLLDQQDELNSDIVGKIKSYQWVKTLLEAEQEAFKARYNYWKDVASKDKKTSDARGNAVEGIKNRAVGLLRTQPGESVKIDGKKVYLRDYYKVTITDEDVAYPHLSEHDLAGKRISIEGEKADELMEYLKLIQGEMQTPQAEPIALSPQANTAILQAMVILQNASTGIVLAGGKELNKHGKEIHETYLRETAEARKQLADINELLNNPAPIGPEDESGMEFLQQLEEEKAEILAWLDKMEKANSIPGAEIQLSKSVFGL